MVYFRKKTLICSNFIIIVGALLVGSSKMARSFEIILIGRFLYGISAGRMGRRAWVLTLGEAKCTPWMRRDGHGGGDLLIPVILLLKDSA